MLNDNWGVTNMYRYLYEVNNQTLTNDLVWKYIIY